MAETHHGHAALMPSPISGETVHMRRALVLLLVVRLILSIAFSLATPLGEAPDEADHYAYAAYILEKGELPAGPEMTQGKHPPLYHILAAAAGKLVGGSPDRSFLRANPDMAFGTQSQATNFFIHTTVEDWPWREGVLTMRAGRFVSILAGLVLVIATYLLGHAIWPARPELALAGAAFAAFLPESLFVSGAMSNDVLAAMWSTLALWLALRGARVELQVVARSQPDHPAIENAHASTGQQAARPVQPDRPAIMNVHELTGQRAGQPVQPDRPAINRRASKQRPLKRANPIGGGSVSPLEGALFRSPASLAPDGGGARRPLFSAILTGICLGLAFVTKASTGSLAVIVTAVFLVSAWQGAPRDSQRPRLWPGLRALAPGLVQVALAGATAFLIASPWLWRNWRLYGDPFGWPVVLATIDQRQGPLGPADVMQLLSGWWLSFWGKFGGAGHIPLPTVLYVIWAAIGAAALVGWVLRLVGKAREHDMRGTRERQVPGTSKVPGTYGRAKVPGTYGDTRERQVPGTSEVPGTYRHARASIGVCAWIILLGAPLVTAAGIYSYSKVALGTDQGRLLFPALAPIALLVAGCLSAWLPRRATGAAATHQATLWTVLFSGGMALVAIAALITGLVQPFAPPPAPLPERIAASQPVNATFGPLELVATAWDDPAPGQLTLYWRAIQGTTDDLRTALRLFDAGGNLLWEWKRSPGAGRLSTDRWPSGRVVADTYRPPHEALSKAVRVEVGVRPFPEGPWFPVAGLAAGQLLSIPR